MGLSLEREDAAGVHAGLSCPYCSAPLRSRWLEAGVSGILSCGCGESPIIDGIAWLERRKDLLMREDPARVDALQKLRDGDLQSARCQALLRSSRAPARRLVTLLERLERHAPDFILKRCRDHIRESVLARSDLTFAQAAAELRNGPYADYLLHRFANPSLLASIPVMLLLQELRSWARPRVLEIGGGTGHASFLMSRWFPGLDFTLTDGDFTNVYLAKRFMARGASCLCIDAEARLPFGDHSFDAVYCQDSFHYLREKAGLVDELRRVVRPGGLWLFPHLHNALGNNRAPGFPLSPEDYSRLFSFLDARLFPEMSLLEQFHGRQRIDLSAPAAGESLERADTLTMIAGPASLWKVHEFDSLFLNPGRDLAINPIYRHAATGDPGPLEWPNGNLRDECLAAERFLPQHPRVPDGLVSRIRRGEAEDSEVSVIRDLIRSFVLVPLPDNYSPHYASSTAALTPSDRSSRSISAR